MKSFVNPCSGIFLKVLAATQELSGEKRTRPIPHVQRTGTLYAHHSLPSNKSMTFYETVGRLVKVVSANGASRRLD